MEAQMYANPRASLQLKFPPIEPDSIEWRWLNESANFGVAQVQLLRRYVGSTEPINFMKGTHAALKDFITDPGFTENKILLDMHPVND
jgi:hypothetical protein